MDIPSIYGWRISTSGMQHEHQVEYSPFVLDRADGPTVSGKTRYSFTSEAAISEFWKLQVLAEALCLTCCILTVLRAKQSRVCSADISSHQIAHD